MNCLGNLIFVFLCYFLKPVDLSNLRVTLACGIFKMCFDKKEDTLWIGPEKPGVPAEAPSLSELFGFGSGDFALGTESRFWHCIVLAHNHHNYNVFLNRLFCCLKIITPTKKTT